MSTINPETMKQLLQEFVEKESLVIEEVKVVQQQIEELEGRIQSCREKLKTVSEDKEKITSMQGRYAGGLGLAAGKDEARLSSTAAPSIQPAKPTPEAALQAAGAMTNLAQALADTSPAQGQAAKPEAAKAGSSKLLDGILAGAGQGAESADASGAQAAPAASTEPAEAQTEAASAKPETSEENADDAVKSINDALRGLFR
jgi:hypothetical protein